MGIENLLAQGYRSNIEPLSNVLMRQQQMQDAKQRNALMQMQIQGAQEQAAAQKQNALMQQQWREGLQVPQGAQYVEPGRPAMNAAQAESAAMLPGYGMSSAQDQVRTAPADPRQVQAVQMAKAGMMSPMDLFKIQNPETETASAAAGSIVYDKRTGKQIMQVPDRADKPTSAVQEYQFAVGQGYKGTYEQWVKEKARAGASSTSVSYSTPVEAVDAAGNRVFIRTTKDGMTPAIIPGVRPPMSAAEERSAAEKAQRERQGQQMASAMEDAKRILSSGKATASGVGNLVDAGARMVGQTTVGAQDAARLEALSGWLVANVPRMEGPQSNFDVQNYTTMAGKVGDRTVPIKERLQALDTVQTLQRKYAEINGTPAAAPAKPSGGVVDWGSLK
jgi:hypothetical protein